MIDFVIARLIEQLQQHYQEKVSGLGRGVGGCGGGRGIGAGERAKWVFSLSLKMKTERRGGKETSSLYQALRRKGAENNKLQKEKKNEKWVEKCGRAGGSQGLLSL